MSTKHRPAQSLHQRARKTVRWASILTVANIIVGYAISLYALEVRTGVEGGVRALLEQSWWMPIAAIAFGLGSVLLFNKLLPRRFFRLRTQPALAEVQLPITSRVQREIRQPDSVAGRQLRRIEADREGDDVVVYLHGLGLDAGDFRHLMERSPLASIAPTQYGFNTDEADDPTYTAVDLDTHLTLLLDMVLAGVRTDNRRARITVVGFSSGADLMLLAAERYGDRLAELGIDHVVLLDPNVNRSTTVLSGRLAGLDPEAGLHQLNKISDNASAHDFAFLSMYVAKICRKDLHHLVHHADQVAGEWDVDGTELYFKRLRQLEQHVGHVSTVFSTAYQHLCGDLAKGDANSAPHFPSLGHFELLDHDLLSPIIDPRPKRRE